MLAQSVTGLLSFTRHIAQNSNESDLVCTSVYLYRKNKLIKEQNEANV